MSRHRFHRGERLKSRQEISRLFGREGHSFAQYPLRLIWRPLDNRRSEYPVQFTVSVPKRKFKQAVQRNRLRRRVREAYRLNKHELYAGLTPDHPQFAWLVLYIGKEEASMATLEKAMKKMIRRFQQKI